MAEGNQETSESQPVRINPEVLTSLGLSQDDVDRLNKEKLEKEKSLQDSRIQGAESYKAFRTSPESGYVKFIIGGGVSVRADTPKPDEVPDKLMETWPIFKSQNPMPEVHDPQVEKRLKAFLMGFGQQALNDGDWKSGLNALDISTDGGIMQNRFALDKFREIAEADKTAGVEIAQAIQERINGRKEATQQTPNPQRIPPEQRTPPEYAADNPRRVNVGGQQEHPADLRPAPDQGSV